MFEQFIIDKIYSGKSPYNSFEQSFIIIPTTAEMSYNNKLHLLETKWNGFNLYAVDNVKHLPLHDYFALYLSVVTSNLDKINVEAEYNKKLSLYKKSLVFSLFSFILKQSLCFI